MLIDPTREDPWRFLVLDVVSGWIAPRFHKDGTLDPRGKATLYVLDTINYEVTADGRAQMIGCFLAAVDDAIEANDWVAGLRILADYMQQDEFGVGSWFVVWEGANHPRVAELRRSYPEAWHRVVRIVTRVRDEAQEASS